MLLSSSSCSTFDDGRYSTPAPPKALRTDPRCTNRAFRSSTNCDRYDPPSALSPDSSNLRTRLNNQWNTPLLLSTVRSSSCRPLLQHAACPHIRNVPSRRNCLTCSSMWHAPPGSHHFCTHARYRRHLTPDQIISPHSCVYARHITNTKTMNYYDTHIAYTLIHTLFLSPHPDH